jgi:hypothetical protein
MAAKTTVFKRDIRNQFTSGISSTRKDVPSGESLIFRAEPSLINMQQCARGEETKITIHVQKEKQLRCKFLISKGTIIKLAGLTTCGSSAAVAIASQMTP